MSSSLEKPTPAASNSHPKRPWLLRSGPWFALTSVAGILAWVSWKFSGLPLSRHSAIVITSSLVVMILSASPTLIFRYMQTPHKSNAFAQSMAVLCALAYVGFSVQPSLSAALAHGPANSFAKDLGQVFFWVRMLSAPLTLLGLLFSPDVS